MLTDLDHDLCYSVTNGGSTEQYLDSRVQAEPFRRGRTRAKTETVIGDWTAAGGLCVRPAAGLGPHLQLRKRHAVRGAGRVVDERHLAEKAARLEHLHLPLSTLRATAWLNMVLTSPSKPSALVCSVCAGSSGFRRMSLNPARPIRSPVSQQPISRQHDLPEVTSAAPNTA